MRERDLVIDFSSFLKNHLGTFDRVYDRHWSLHFIINAQASLMIDDQHYDLQGTWFWAGYPGPRYQQYGGEPLPSGHYRAALHGSLLAGWLEEGFWPRVPLPIHDSTRMSDRFEILLQHQHGSTPLHNRQRAHALEGILLEAWSQQEQAPQQALWLSRCCDYLEAHACSGIHYQRLADRLQIPLPTLRRHFRRSMGMPMHRYVLEHRCRLAHALLLETDKKLEEIAFDLGYEDVAYFSRQFKKVTGSNPSALRKQRFY